MQKEVIVFMVFFLFLVSCASEQGARQEAYEKQNSLYTGDLQYPSVSTIVSPSNPEVGKPFILTVNAEDDKGIKDIAWESSRIFSNAGSSDSFSCTGQKTCSQSWELIPIEEGTYQFIVQVEDTSAKRIESGKVEVMVGPAQKTSVPSLVPSPTTPLSSSSVPTDATPSPWFVCGNALCEGGESYESCPKDCTLEDIVGSRCNDGFCEPGEDAHNCPKDCTTINLKCGNKICDTGETRETCLADCEIESFGDGGSCTSSSDCGYKQRCNSGKCVSVECTSDYQCKGCSRCSDNQCVSCGYGAAGYCTC